MYALLFYSMSVFVMLFPFFCEMFFFVILVLYLFVFIRFVFINYGSIFIQYNLTNLKQVLVNVMKKLRVLLKAFVDSNKNVLKVIHNVFTISVLRWQPLFKKTSYFGLYRATRGRWDNKTEGMFK